MGRVGLQFRIKERSKGSMTEPRAVSYSTSPDRPPSGPSLSTSVSCLKQSYLKERYKRGSTY